MQASAIVRSAESYIFEAWFPFSQNIVRGHDRSLERPTQPNRVTRPEISSDWCNKVLGE